jgi:hypothetical protein
MDRPGGWHPLSLCKPAKNSSRSLVEAMYPLPIFRLGFVDQFTYPEFTKEQFR